MSRATRFRCAAILTDIEGTTGSTAFVKDVLFPYARAHIAGYVAQHRDDPDVVRALHDAALLAGEPGADEARIIDMLKAWIDEDRKATPLKTLQGLIWTEGYERTGLRGHVYDDAVAGLRRWHAAGIKLYVYSSGSIRAQQLLFGHSTAGDLRGLFEGYFDTTIGAKTEPSSYAKIAAAAGLRPADLLFLSDREAELDAAHAAGCGVAALLRSNDAPPGATSAYPAFASFADIEAER